MVDVAYALRNKLNFDQVVFWYAYSKLTDKLTKQRKISILETYNNFMKETNNILATVEALLYLIRINNLYNSNEFEGKFIRFVLEYQKTPKKSFKLIKSYKKLICRKLSLNGNTFDNDEVLFRRLAITEDPKREKKYLKYYPSLDESVYDWSYKKNLDILEFIDRNPEYVKYYNKYLTFTNIKKLDKLIKRLESQNVTKNYIKYFIRIFVISNSKESPKNSDVLLEMKRLIGKYSFWKQMCIRILGELGNNSSFDVTDYVYEYYEAGIYNSKLSVLEQRLQCSEIVTSRIETYKNNQ